MKLVDCGCGGHERKMMDGDYLYPSGFDHRCEIVDCSFSNDAMKK